MDKVLVILATYNGEKYLAEQLESVFEQAGVEVSVLVRDDGSSDGTKKLLDKYVQSHPLEWYTGKHLNVQKGYFDLMCRAAGYDVDYIAFCDQDDVWDKDKLYVAVQKLNEADEAVPALYYCGQRLVDENLNFIENHILNAQRTLTTRFVLSDFAGCTGVFNMALLREVVKFRPGYMLMHDTWTLKVCLALGGKVFVDPQPHIDYRQHGGNTLGLQRSVKGYIKQVDQYINKYHVEKQMHELMRGYADRMVPEYKRLAAYICGYRKNRKFRKKLLDKSYINFYNRGLNLTYRLKIALNKL